MGWLLCRRIVCGFTSSNLIFTSPMDNPIEIVSPATFHDMLQFHRYVLTDFYATWCEPCKMLDAMLLRIAPKLEPGIQIVKIDTDRHGSLAETYNIHSVPVLMLFVNGEPVWRMNGFMMDEELIRKVRHELMK